MIKKEGFKKPSFLFLILYLFHCLIENVATYSLSLQNLIVFHIPKAQVLSIQDPANHEYAPDLFPWYVEFWAPNTPYWIGWHAHNGFYNYVHANNIRG